MDVREKLVEIVGTALDGTLLNITDSVVDCVVDALIAHGVTVQEWISVKDRLPSDRGDVLVCAWWHEKWQAMTGWYAITSDMWHILTPDGFLPWDYVTHWMPLPQPPKGE